MFECEYCSKQFTRKDHQKRHEDYCKMANSQTVRVKCNYCNTSFTRKDALTRHIIKCEMKSQRKLNCDIDDGPLSKKVRCDLCDIDVANQHMHLRSVEHKNKTCKADEDDEHTQIIRTAYESRIATYRVYSKTTLLTPIDFLNNVKDRVMKLIRCKQSEGRSAVKVNLELFAEYTKWIKTDTNGGDGDEREATEIKSFNTKNKVLHLENGDLEEAYSSFAETICAKADEFQERGSGWALQIIKYLEVNINKWQPFKGSSFIPLPKAIKAKKACVNIKNTDQACFAWAVVAALYPTNKHSDRVTSYPHYKDKLNLQGITFPITMRNIKTFENINNISVNVFEISGRNIAGPIYHTRQKREKHVNLLLIEEGDKAHYCWVKNLSKLISSQLSRSRRQTYICDSCLLTFSAEKNLAKHVKRGCSQIKTHLPLPGKNILTFKNYSHRLRAPVVVYADFEALLLPIRGCEPSNSSTYTMNYQLHEPYSYGYFIKCSYDDSLSKYITYRGEDCAKEFLISLERELAPFADKMTQVIPMMPLTIEQQQIFNAAMNCHICGRQLDEDRVRDHCHLTGKFRGVAHNKCNLNFKIKPIIPVVLHNLSKYDSHFLITKFQGRTVSILPKNKENFIAFSSVKHGSLNLDLRFIDSYRFLASSLDKLAADLESNQFTVSKTHCTEHLELLTRKGVFPYDYMDSFTRLEETALPPQSCFYNKLNGSSISDEQYRHAQQVWTAFNIKTLGEYSDLYLKTDVLLLADVFENFRNVCLRTYQLDPAHYYTAPGLSWDAMLSTTKVEMELLTDYEMVQFITSGIRGGLSQCSRKYASANNKYIGDYEQDKPSNYIIYLDANNQYGWAMSQYMPLKDFHWLLKGEVENFNVMEISSNASTGYILEVDLDYPAHLHETHSDLCFCPENRVPELIGARTSKLLSTLHCKRNYAIHYVNLKQAMNAGLVLKKIHRILAFSQSPWLKKYIDLNTVKRMEAKNPFEKDFFKLMNNAVFGKTMENVDKRVDVRMVNQWESDGKRLGARALISRLNFHSLTIIDEDLCIIQMNRNSVNYNKPIYVGFTVLEVSKTLMYDFHYNYILPL